MSKYLLKIKKPLKGAMKYIKNELKKKEVKLSFSFVP
jgi:hypothetical protein